MMNDCCCQPFIPHDVFLYTSTALDHVPSLQHQTPTLFPCFSRFSTLSKAYMITTLLIYFYSLFKCFFITCPKLTLTKSRAIHLHRNVK